MTYKKPLNPDEVDWTKYHRGPMGRIVPNTLNQNLKGKKHPPTKIDLAFAREYIANGGNATKAIKKVQPGATRQAASYRKKKLTFSLLMDKEGVTDKMLVQVLREGLMARKTLTSPTEPDREVDDHPTRHKFLETALKVKGHMNNIEQQNNIQVNILDYKENSD